MLDILKMKLVFASNLINRTTNIFITNAKI